MTSVNFPVEWRFVPVLRGKKSPIAVSEGNWVEQGKPWGEARESLNKWVKGFSETRKREGKDPWFNAQVGAIGVLCGENSGGLLLLDHDGESCTANIINKWGELPDTWKVSSGRPGHWQWVFRIPEMFWPGIANCQYKSIGADGVVVKDADGKDEHIELRWNGQQSLVWGEHPDTKRNYEWSNTDVEIAEAPIWLIEKMLKPEHQAPVATVKPPKSNPPQSAHVEMSDSDWGSEYLNAIDPNNLGWYEWRNCVLAAHQAGLSESQVESWSATSSKHTHRGFSDVWRHIKGNCSNPASLGTLGFIAKHHGWQPKPKAQSQAKTQKRYTDIIPERPKTLAEIEESVRVSGDEAEQQYLQIRMEISAAMATSDSQLRYYKLQKIASRNSVPMAYVNGLIASLQERQNPTSNTVYLSDLQKMEFQGSKWLIPRFMPACGLTMLAGFAKDGKTTLIWDMIRALVTGTEFLGQKVDKPCNVLFIECEETDNRRLAERMESVGLDDEPEAGERLRIEKSWAIGDLDKLERLIAEHQASVVIFDSLRKVLSKTGLTENSQEVAGPVYDLTTCLNNLGVAGVIIHHTKKSSKDGGGTVWEKFAGSSALLGAVDNLAAFYRAAPADDKDTTRKLAFMGRDCKGGFMLNWVEEEYPRFRYDCLFEQGVNSDDKKLQDRILDVITMNAKFNPELSAQQIKDFMQLHIDDKTIYKPLRQLVDGQVLSMRKVATGSSKKRISYYRLPTPPLSVSTAFVDTNSSTPYTASVSDSIQQVSNPQSLDTNSNLDTNYQAQQSLNQQVSQNGHQVSSGGVDTNSRGDGYLLDTNSNPYPATVSGVSIQAPPTFTQGGGRFNSDSRFASLPTDAKPNIRKRTNPFEEPVLSDSIGDKMGASQVACEVKQSIELEGRVFQVGQRFEVTLDNVDPDMRKEMLKSPNCPAGKTCTVTGWGTSSVVPWLKTMLIQAVLDNGEYLEVPPEDLKEINS